jgi:thiamine monophosphate synthase
VLGVAAAEIDRLAAAGAFGTAVTEAVTEEKSKTTAAGATLD